ncbi:MAG: phytase [Chloroherpetonaceae bacterium]|nr:phytase [Chthonomonadaceae bacterium]MDW8209129.1 phytase [Chloroherpetonaceae bacterium]
MLCAVSRLWPARSLLCATLPLLFLSDQPADAPLTATPVLATQPVSTDPDDPAIWVHPDRPERSLLLGTNKTAAPDGALYVFDLRGRVRQVIRGLDRPNNVDVEYGLRLNGQPVDIAVVTERLQRRLRVYRISPRTGQLQDITSFGNTQVFTGEPGEQGAPMGIGLYRRPKDGAIFAIVSRKEGPTEGYLWQYRLQDDGRGRVAAVLVRKFGRFSGRGEIEAIAVDDPPGYVYYADEGDGIHKWYADPDHPDADRELAHFGKTGFQGDREGIAIYAQADGTGYVLCTDQLPGNSAYHLFRREGEPGNPHDHSRTIRIVLGGADETDGLDATAVPLGRAFPGGLIIAMNSGKKNFLVFRPEDFGLTARPAALRGSRTKSHP